jgi:hypothetical protein
MRRFIPAIVAQDRGPQDHPAIRVAVALSDVYDARQVLASPAATDLPDGDFLHRRRCASARHDGGRGRRSSLSVWSSGVDRLQRLLAAPDPGVGAGFAQIVIKPRLDERPAERQFRLVDILSDLPLQQSLPLGRRLLVRLVHWLAKAA